MGLDKKVTNYFPENNNNRDFENYFNMFGNRDLVEYTKKIYELEYNYNLDTGERKVLDVLIDQDQDLVSQIYQRLSVQLGDEQITEARIKEELMTLISDRYDTSELESVFANKFQNKIELLLQQKDLLIDTTTSQLSSSSKKKLDLLLKGEDENFIKQKYEEYLTTIRRR